MSVTNFAKSTKWHSKPVDIPFKNVKLHDLTALREITMGIAPVGHTFLALTSDHCMQ